MVPGGQERLLCRCKLAVLQYITITLVSTIIANIYEFFKVHKEGTFSWSRAWVYLLIITDVSHAIATYSIMVFYHSLKEKLTTIQPLGKFV